MTVVDLNPVSAVLCQAQYFPHAEVLVYGDRTWTYQSLVDETRILASALRTRGVGHGDRVAYLGFNSVSFIETMLAAWWIGAVFAPLNFRLAPHEVRSILEQAQPSVIVVEPSHLETIDVADHKDISTTTTTVVVVDNDPEIPAPETIADHYTPMSALINVENQATLPVVATSDDLAALMFTSGTTGTPKGVQLTHGNIWWNQLNVDSIVDTRRCDTNLAAAPLFHIGGLNALTIRTITRGGRTIIRRAFDPRQALDDIEQYDVAQAFLVPAMLSAMQATPDFETRDLSSLRALICAGAPVPPVLIEQYQLKAVAVQQAWGLTETSPFATYLPSELTHVKPGSCGIPMPYTDVQIMDTDTGRRLPAGESGEMWVRGPNVTAGYWNNGEATDAAFTDGWFRSGDIGYQDDEGYFYVVDRLKDMIITGGENVYPAELERTLMEYPDVRDVAVVGVQDAQWGEAVTAVMSFHVGPAPSIEQVRDFAAERLARYKLPKHLIVTDTIARNGSGKLDKPAIRTLAVEALDSQ
ncbi:acyl-CoA synthetase [Rhodococcus opacus]|uniref:acyl-CoA synthetase n=1 Tax=Rhodococcus opacus TaxID=37919 RepID=UPI001C4764EA|nr:long-chain fatty acid--CoA ligase [Rhodococcus opacus]MBV6760444.1 long-chain fatty acid--CoA ligase [Rhodococcus opacus]